LGHFHLPILRLEQPWRASGLGSNPIPEVFFAAVPRVPYRQTLRGIAVCDEHYRLTLRGPHFPPARPGQFVTVACPRALSVTPADESTNGPFLLRRAFSIAGLRRRNEGVEIDLLYHAVGAATRWMAGLKPRDPVSVMGPLGNGFPPPRSGKAIWIVGGGIGLPPLLWLAESLTGAGHSVLLFAGARGARFLPCALRTDSSVSEDGITPTTCLGDFPADKLHAILSTDDGSLGYRGTILQAVQRCFAARGTPGHAVVIYACGPEPMLRALGRWATEGGVECYLCTERTMACGMGTCQSCVIPVRSDTDPDGWRYRLCCTDGPVFAAKDILWTPPG